MVILIMLLSQFEALGDQVNIPLCGFYSRRRLLLEGVEHIASPPKAHLVHRPIGVGREVVNDFEYPGPFALPRFRSRMLAAKLSQAQGGAHAVFHRFREAQQVLLGRSDP
jgi:hypothetical protein